MGQAVFDTLAWVYLGLAIAWTVLLAGGLIFLYIHRHKPCIKIRRLPVLIVGILFLHAYGFACCIAYIIAPFAPCVAEYWMMSLYLPFGFAMFHAANSQFLYISSRQKQYARMDTVKHRRSVQSVAEDQAEQLANSRFKRILRGVERADRINRTLIFIAIGIVVQIIVTLFIFFGSKKFHANYGIWDYEVVGTQMEVRMKCSKGWEWWPSLAWQFFWAWIYAPYMLWKSRGVRDVHGWRIQTILCCIFGLPASPLWLAGLYLPQMAPVNKYIVPPTWFALSIFFIELVSVGFPVVQVLKTQTLTRETLDAIAAWEKRQQFHADDNTIAESGLGSPKGSTFSGTTYMTSPSTPTTPTKTSFESQKSAMLTMAALENALRLNPEPLMQFAALKDFSGENVSFLANVTEWKREGLYSKLPAEEHLQNQFIFAVQIYASFISLDISEFPINISSKEMKRLYQIFEPATKLLFRNGSICSAGSATPFDSTLPDACSTSDLQTGINLDKISRGKLQSITGMTKLDKTSSLDKIPIPEEFSQSVFDSAETEIKYLVLTNTWPKFVRSGESSPATSQHSKNENGNDRWKKILLCDV